MIKYYYYCILLILKIEILLLLKLSSSSSGFDCGHYGNWNIENNNTKIFDIVQQWLTQWQKQCDKDFYYGLPLGQGIGSDIIGASNWFEFAIENNKVFRPPYYWIWSDIDVSNCSIPNSKGTIDCYFEPISPCGLNSSQLKLVSTSSAETNYINEAYDLFNYLNQTDACYLAFKSKHSIQWIHGSFLHYITRPRKDLVQYYAQRRNLLFEKNNKEGKIIGVHVRGGSPDNGRHVANVSYYIEAIDIIAKELNEEVTTVFMCSDLPEKTLVSEVYLSTTYPRPWKYVLLSHLSLPSDEHMEAAFALKADLDHKYSRKQLATEFMSDVDILTNTDAFIGTWSNMYTLVTALRIARGKNTFQKHACFLHIGYVPRPKFLCEGSEEAKEIWRLQTGGRGYSGKEGVGPPNWEGFYSVSR